MSHRNGTALALDEVRPGFEKACSHEDSLAEILGALGLNKNEILVYRTLLSLGPRPAGMISKRTNLKRGQIYNLLSNLAAKGIVQEFLKGHVRHFVCSEPEKLVSILQSRQDKLETHKSQLLEILPYLRHLGNPVGSRAAVRSYSGIDGAKQVLDDMISEPISAIYALTDFEYSWAFLDGKEHDWVNNFIERRAERDIWWYGIINRSDASDYGLGTRPSPKRKVKMIEDIVIKSEISLYGPKISVITTTHEVSCLVIENEHLADTLRNIHQTVWEILPDYPLKKTKVDPE